MDNFKIFLNESDKWKRATSDDYSLLFTLADYIEENPTELKLWFQQFRNVIISFIQKAKQFGEIHLDEPLDHFLNWLQLHMLNAANRVLDDNIKHNGPLFSVSQAIKNSYEGLSSYLHEDIDEKVKKLIGDYINFIRTIFPFFLRMANYHWKDSNRKNDTFQRLSSIPKFND